MISLILSLALSAPIPPGAAIPRNVQPGTTWIDREDHRWTVDFIFWGDYIVSSTYVYSEADEDMEEATVLYDLSTLEGLRAKRLLDRQ